MSELRFDRLRGVWAIVAPERRQAGGHRGEGLARPPAALPSPSGPCPFCPGNESSTERERLRVPAAGPWALRIVDNRYPVLQGDPIESGPPGASWGRHEVLIEHPDHDPDLADFDRAQLERILRAARDRLAAFAALPGIEEVVFFRNRGQRAGSSQPHPHSQLMALPRISNERARRQACARAHAEATGASLLLAVLEEEVLGSERLVLVASAHLAYCPIAPQRPGLVRLAPTSGRGLFRELTDEALEDLAGLLGPLLRAQRRASGGSAYNLLLHEPPLAEARGPASFWVLELVPRTSGWAGFELATGVDILLEAPEQSAAALRAALQSEPEG